MSDFDPSPRSSKRRKFATYGSNRSTATSPGVKSASVLLSISNAVSGISRRLFEPQTKQATTKLDVNTADAVKEPNRDSKGGLQKTSQADDEEEDMEIHDADVGTDQSAGQENRATGEEDALTPVRKSKNPNRTIRDSTRDAASHKKSSVRKPRATEEIMCASANVSVNNRRTSSFSKRRFITGVDAEVIVGQGGHTRGTSAVSSRGRQATSSKQREPRLVTSASRKVLEGPTRENREENEGAMIASQRSSGREKRKPRRYSEDVENMAEQLRKQPVGILTPSKRNRTGLRKSVAFEDEDEQLGDQLNFKDITDRSQAPDSARRKRRAKNSHPAKARQSEPLSMSPEAAPLGEGDEPEEELAVEDTPFLDSLSVLNPPSDTMPIWDSLPEAHEDPSLTAIKSRVISRLTNSSLVPLSNLTAEYAKVHSLLKATITAGEGNSMLVLGARGSGKTNLTETALADVSREHAEDFHVVRLNGFQQTDDKIALREIWRQLGREMQVEEDETNQVSSYADTMASLLHLLSHPEELAEALEPDAPATTPKSVVFVLDEFDLFATHPRQTLLYNLFDIAQAKKAPIAVIGCSTRVDVAEALEKRVKSRFSHRWVHLSQPKSFQAFEAVVKAALLLDADEDQLMDDPIGSRREAWNEYMKSTFIPSPTVQAVLRQTFYTTKSIAAIFSSLYIPVASITSLDNPPKPMSLAPLTPPDSPLQLLPSLPPLHLYLLIAAARLDAIHNVSVVNFNLIYHHHVELASRSRLQSSASGALAQGGVTKIWGKEIAKGAWEELGDWEILVPAALGKGKGDDAPETKMWRVDVTLEEVAACIGDVGPGVREVLAKWCKEV